ncbi:MAG: 2Fe-2S iron-sulfur cluster-binding protein [Planctomycetota bacterium]|nr:2Fe-2S iron-sulfur cluster-binding protein [Planctomycetota bacterium]
MPSITINGRVCDFAPGQTILQIANTHGIEIPQYCYHDGLSIVASCRICLVEIHAPNPRTGQVEPFMGGKLMPSCQQTASDGMIVFADSPKAVANQKAVMEYLLINHPLDCPVCDQSGECFLQDYSYLYGRGVSRFEEQKVKQPKKDLGPNVLLYADRCIMCTRCVRFTREVTGTSELCVTGRGNKEEIDVFPGVAIDNELSANVIDLCPVGALLDKDFLFAQRVWFLKETPSVDGITSSGDNIWVHHNEGKVYRVKPRHNPRINKWWITDEVRYAWKFVHADQRLRSPARKQYGVPVACDWPRAYDDLLEGAHKAVAQGKRLALMVSPFLSCEEAFLLATLARTIDPQARLALGPVPVVGQDKTFPLGAAPDAPNAFTVRAEKAPNARGVRRVLEAVAGHADDFDAFLRTLGKGTGSSDVGAVILAANAPDPATAAALEPCLAGKFVALIDILPSPLTDRADVVLPGATWLEKSGTFQNAANVLQAFEQAIPVLDGARAEGQIALDLAAVLRAGGVQPASRARVVLETTRGQVAAGATISVPVGEAFSAPAVRGRMAEAFPALAPFTRDVLLPPVEASVAPDMAVVDL